jgi:hypothetical protein
MPRLYRTQILLDPLQHRELGEVARREGRSVSDVVREMIDRQLSQRRQEAVQAQQRRLAALARIRERWQNRSLQDALETSLDVVSLIERARQERDQQILGDRERD